MSKCAGALATLVVAAVCLGAYSQGVQSENVEPATSFVHAQQQDFKTLMDRFSYAYGADLAEKFRAEGIELNVDLMAEAMKTTFKGAEKRMSADETAATIELYREVHLKKKDKERAIAAEKNSKEGEAFLAANARKDGVVVTESGLQYKVIKEGSGGRKPTENDEVKVHYRGTFIDGTQFDSTLERDEPFSAQVKQLISGWSEALQLMSEGSKWELYVPSEIAYGERGSEPYIGPNAVLIFEVELLEIGS
ncbi:FKBP-type peptidyl-prolyl cis-trans isomerase [Gilvimarinus sp. F26214L]|uniref:FKBP-type peptidyl-prolyl cis-trans isomerase n=1 Tax=Gilvimarinus sp. DZF01 TaxID=3461371 RepID=UPI00404665C4